MEHGACGTVEEELPATVTRRRRGGRAAGEEGAAGPIDD
jgi:hypothetical protein